MVARSWQRALCDLGISVTTIAGSGTADLIIPAISWPTPELSESELDLISVLERALADIDLVIVENLCSLPLNRVASDALARVLTGRPAVLHHHDMAWQRPWFHDVTDMPPDDPTWRHVTLNDRTRKELFERGISATTIANGFDVDEALGDRAATRMKLGVAEDEWLILHPVRAIKRKGIPLALSLAESLGTTYWITGLPEEDYADTLTSLIENATCRVIHEPFPTSLPDAYAACDLVAFPSTWEGFGNPLIESAIHRRALAVSRYPVARDIEELGFRWFDPGDPDAIRAFLSMGSDSPSVKALHDHNAALARAHFSQDRVRQELRALLADMGMV